MKSQITKLSNKDPNIIKLFNEDVKRHEEVRAHIGFAYAHYDEFIQYCKDVAEGNRKPYFK